MSNELSLHYATGYEIKGLVWGPDRSYRWNGSSMVPPSTIADAVWATGMVDMVELLTSDGTYTGQYIGSVPSTATTGELQIDYFIGNSPLPGAVRLGYQTYDESVTVNVGEWGGTPVTTSANNKPEVDIVSVTGQSVVIATEFEADVTKIHGTALTETDGQLAGRFVDFFDHSTTGYSVATSLDDFKADVSDIPTNAEFIERTLPSGDYFSSILDTVNVGSWSGVDVSISPTTNRPEVDVYSISDDSTAANNLESTYDGDGYINSYAPAQQQQLDNLSIGSASISIHATTGVVNSGTVIAGTYDSTEARDGIYHQIDDSANILEAIYDFNIGGNGVPVSVTIYGRSYSIGDNIKVEAYSFNSSQYEQVGTIVGGASSIDSEHTFSLYTSHVGIGPDIGIVKVRFWANDLTNCNFYIDQLYLSYAVVAQSVGYANGAIWVDTNVSNTNTTVYVDGVADNPVSTWGAALSLSNTLGLKKFQIANGSTITLTDDTTNYTLNGENWSLNLNNQIIAGMFAHGATINGTGLNGGEDAFFSFCDIENVSLPGSSFNKCAIIGPIALTEASTYFFEGCFSAIAGILVPSIDFSSTIGSTNVNFRHYSGGIEIKNMGVSGTDNMSLEGHGQYIINANCVGGTLAVRGHFKKTDNSTLVTISDDANFKSTVIAFGNVVTSTNNTITLSSDASIADGAYDPAAIFIAEGTGAGQTRLILEYNGSTQTAVVDRNWKVNPDTTSVYRIMAHPGREHINEGLARDGDSNTIKLNALASTANDTYNNQTIFIRSGQGEDQVRVITDYDGLTQTATVNRTWDNIPDATSAYIMIPNQSYPFDATTDLAITNAKIDAVHVDVSGIPTIAEFEARTLPSGDYFNINRDAIVTGVAIKLDTMIEEV